MLSRSGSDTNIPTSKRLQRSKSASSVQERKKHPILCEPVDPTTARMQSLVAAHRAMERSAGEHSIELRRSCSTDRQRLIRPLAARSRTSSEHVRFSAARSAGKERFDPLKQHKTTATASATHYDATEASSTYVDDHQGSPLGHLSPTKISKSRHRYPSQPSSYRRPRKAKSMFTPIRRTFSVQYLKPQRLSPVHTGRSLRAANSSAGFSTSRRWGTKVRRSFSFSHPTGTDVVEASNTIGTTTTHSAEAVRIAREQFLKEVHEQSLKPKKSLLFGSRARKEQKTFRKSLRSGTAVLFGNKNKSNNTGDAEELFGPKGRSVSTSFRDRIKTFLTRSMSSKTGLPPQQLEATRSHYADFGGLRIPTNGSDAPFGSVQDEFEHRASMYIPLSGASGTLSDAEKTLAAFQSFDRQPSWRSASRSRVTSWTDSTATGMGSFRGAAIDPKRLSVIKEDGGPHYSGSATVRRYGDLHPFNEPIGPAAVDSQRIYSALMHRMDQEQTEVELTQKHLDEIHATHQRLHQDTCEGSTTIRPVHSENSLEVIQHVPDPEHTEPSIGKHDWGRGDDATDSSSSMSPERRNQNTDRRKAKLTAEETKSSFFPFSGTEEKPKGPSPFKMALMSRNKLTSEYTDITVPTDSTGDSGTTRTMPNDHQPDLIHNGLRMMSSESLYSRTTDGGRNEAYIVPIGSSEEIGVAHLVGQDDETINRLGMATIFQTQPDRYPRPTDRVAKFNLKRRNSVNGAKTRESHDWRGWLEQEMGDGLGKTLSNASKRSGHVREHAQIDGADIDLGRDVDNDECRYPLTELKEMSSGNTALLRFSSDRRLINSQSGLLVKAQAGSDENRKSNPKTSSSRDSMDRARAESSTRLTHTNIGKENRTPTNSLSGDLGRKRRSSELAIKALSGSPSIGTSTRFAGGCRKSGPNGPKQASPEQSAGPQFISTTKQYPKYRFEDSSSSVSSTDTGHVTSIDRSGKASTGRCRDSSVNGWSELYDSSSRRLHNLGSVAKDGLSATSKDHVGSSIEDSVPLVNVTPPNGFGATLRGAKGYGALGLTKSREAVNAEEVRANAVGGSTKASPATTPGSDGVIRSIAQKFSSKRMVSDFLRRRLNKAAAKESTESGEDGDVSSTGQGSPAFI